MFSSGSMRRRRYRFKQGSSSWLKSRKQSAAKRHKTKHMEQANIISLSCSLGNSNCSLTSSQNSSCDELTDIVTSCHNLNQCYTQNSAVQPSTSNTLDDVFCNIPSFDDCIDELFHSFQTDYYNTLWINLLLPLMAHCLIIVTYYRRQYLFLTLSLNIFLVGCMYCYLIQNKNTIKKPPCSVSNSTCINSAHHDTFFCVVNIN